MQTRRLAVAFQQQVLVAKLMKDIAMVTNRHPAMFGSARNSDVVMLQSLRSMAPGWRLGRVMNALATDSVKHRGF
jgi:hypothetical protein